MILIKKSYSVEVYVFAGSGPWTRAAGADVEINTNLMSVVA
jgi:hypothetical protein